MTHKQKAFEKTAATIIKQLERRGMEGYFFADSKSCTEAVLNMMEEGSTVAWGGSESIKECGLMDALKTRSYHLIDRSTAKTPEEQREIFAKSILSDYFLMSSNAVTLDGELVNIDGNANRVACLAHGPRHVMIIVGMNKIVTDVAAGVDRARNIAAPPNAERLSRKTPCGVTGTCGDCLSPDCMCNQILVTRRSGHPGRIKVFFVAEELGY
ncbi:MAG: lactate utilization protein [Lachnospiraceae bacterium]|nr:lactate utilization protein [Lachnospiraceae bacterium]